MPEKLTIEHVKEVCKIGQGGNCCRYISVGANFAQGNNCDGIKSEGKP